MNILPALQSQADTLIIGFDSAWTDNPKNPGAICALGFDSGGIVEFTPPRLASFSQALDFINDIKKNYSFCLVALDQPTIVPNATGSRPVEKVVASVVSFVGGGVQPSNRSKVGMFDDAAPIWSFKRSLGATESPEEIRLSQSGLFLMEVYPALALTGVHSPFAQRLSAPKYDPKNKKKFNISDWKGVTKTVGEIAAILGVPELSNWALDLSTLSDPRKSDQDCLDASICTLIGLIWRTCSRSQSAVIGDMESGYIVTPVSTETRQRLEKAARLKGVPIS